MVVSVTTSFMTAEQLEQVNGFLAEFLPRLKQQSGVLEVLYFTRPLESGGTVVVVWEDDEALHRYRASALSQEALAFERKLGIVTTREAFPLRERLL